MDSFQQIFGFPGQISWAQESARAALVFAYGLVAVRLCGRRLFARWAAIDIIVSIMIGSNLSRALTGNAPLIGTLLATTLLLTLHWLLVRAATVWPLVSRLIEGRAWVLGRNGQIAVRTARQHAVSATDLSEALRQAGLEDAADVRLIILEPSGRISLLKK